MKVSQSGVIKDELALRDYDDAENRDESLDEDLTVDKSALMEWSHDGKYLAACLKKTIVLCQCGKMLTASFS